MKPKMPLTVGGVNLKKHLAQVPVPDETEAPAVLGNISRANLSEMFRVFTATILEATQSMHTYWPTIYFVYTRRKYRTGFIFAELSIDILNKQGMAAAVEELIVHYPSKTWQLEMVLLSVEGQELNVKTGQVDHVVLFGARDITATSLHLVYNIDPTTWHMTRLDDEDRSLNAWTRVDKDPLSGHLFQNTLLDDIMARYSVLISVESLGLL